MWATFFGTISFFAKFRLSLQACGRILDKLIFHWINHRLCSPLRICPTYDSLWIGLKALSGRCLLQTNMLVRQQKVWFSGATWTAQGLFQPTRRLESINRYFLNQLEDRHFYRFVFWHVSYLISTNSKLLDRTCGFTSHQSRCYIFRYVRFWFNNVESCGKCIHRNHILAGMVLRVL